MNCVDNNPDERAFPQSFTHIALVKVQLLRFADDCEERARRCDSADARSRFHVAAADARRCAADRRLGDDGLRLALDALRAQARFASWCAGEPVDAAETVPLAVPQPTPAAAEPPRGPLLNARQLCGLTGVPERTARNRIVRGYRRRLPGFHRDGALWLAELPAFKSLAKG